MGGGFRGLDRLAVKVMFMQNDGVNRLLSLSHGVSRQLYSVPHTVLRLRREV